MSNSISYRKIPSFILFLFILVLISVPSFGITYYVLTNGDNDANGLSWDYAFATIQKGIDSSSDGDTVIVDEGTYAETINLSGKDIHLKSTDPSDWDVIDATIIDPSNTNARVVDIYSGETSDCIFEGFTVSGGMHGIYIDSASTPTVRRCIFENNAYDGFLVYIYSGSLEVSECVSRNNARYGFQGYGDVTLKNCLFADNTKWGIYVTSGSGTFDIENCTVVNNTSYGLYGRFDSITNSILWGNGNDIHNPWSSYTIDYCCVEDGDSGTGNISVDPMFVDSVNENYYLAVNSQCIDAGDPGSSYSNELGTGGGRINMGAYGNTSDATTITDTDADGLADEWENYYWPGDDLADHDPNDDPDSDNLRNIDEFHIGWDPNSDDSSNIIGFVTNDRTKYRYPGIDYSIRLAFPGDKLVMDPNRFVETVDFYGKAVHLTCSDPNDPNVVAATIIDAQDTGARVIDMISGEGSDTILEGITVTGGKHGIYVENSCPTIRKCVFEGHTQYGMYLSLYSVMEMNISECTIQNNTQYGIRAYATSGSSLEISRCVVRNNTDDGFRGYGDITLKNCLFADNNSWGIYVDNNTGTFDIENCTIANNTSYGLYGYFDAITNSILWGNGNDIHNAWSSYTIDYCCVEDSDSGTGNISSNPKFINTANDDYHLADNSPCINAGDPNSSYANEPYGGGGRINMGAYGNTDEATVVLDGDGDGIFDDWERQYWPNDDPNQHDPGDDPDNDLLTNMEEYLIDWNPTQNDTWKIPGFVRNQRTNYKFPLINYAFANATGGDILVVDPNRFLETVDFGGKAIHLISTDPNDPDIVAATIIDANDTNATVVTFSSGETSAACIEGMTITGGKDGIYIDSSSTPTIRKCITEDNSQDGMYINVYSGTLEISECVSRNNTRYGFKGYGYVTVKNCIFADNSSWGIYITDGWGTFNVENCTVVNNSNYGVYGYFDTITNSILWGNGNDIHNAWSNYTINYCCVEDGDSGTGNISLNPQFADAANADYHLKSTQGRWNGTSWTSDGVNSPCIDAAQPWADHSSEPVAANGGRLNLGAYGNTSQASKSVDSDGDGMSDVWETIHFGNLNQDPNGLSGNYDNDDFDNIIEYYFNYDPNAVTTVGTEIINLRQSVSSFDPTLNETVTFDFWINKPLQLILKNADSNDIYYDTQTGVYPGNNQIIWDGTGQSDDLIVLKGNHDWILEDAAETPTLSLGSKNDSSDELVPISLTYDNSVDPLYCSPVRIIPAYNEVANISYGINLGDSFSQWAMSVKIYDPDDNLFYTVLDEVNQNKSTSGTDLRLVTWYGKNGPPDEAASRYPSKTGKYTIKVQFSGMRENTTKAIYIYK